MDLVMRHTHLSAIW